MEFALDDDPDPPKYVRRSVKLMNKRAFEEKYGKEGYLEKNLRDWTFRDVLNFFTKCVTNDRKCIETITTREVNNKQSHQVIRSDISNSWFVAG